MSSNNLQPAIRKLGIVIVFAGLLIAVGMYVGGLNKNYAADVVKSLENAMVKAGGIKQCTRGDSGHGPDNSAPNYMALYEVPGKTDTAIALIQNAAKESGFNLTEGPYPANPGSSKYYSDRTSRQSPYTDLESGNITLIVSVDEGAKYSGDRYCTIVKKDSSDRDKTTIDLTVSLPSFKQHGSNR